MTPRRPFQPTLSCNLVSSAQFIGLMLFKEVTALFSPASVQGEFPASESCPWSVNRVYQDAWKALKQLCNLKSNKNHDFLIIYFPVLMTKYKNKLTHCYMEQQRELGIFSCTCQA